MVVTQGCSNLVMLSSMFTELQQNPNIFTSRPVMYAVYQGHTGKYHHTNLSVSSISILQKYRVNFLFFFYIPVHRFYKDRIISKCICSSSPHLSFFIFGNIKRYFVICLVSNAVFSISHDYEMDI